MSDPSGLDPETLIAATADSIAYMHAFIDGIEVAGAVNLDEERRLFDRMREIEESPSTDLGVSFGLARLLYEAWSIGEHTTDDMRARLRDATARMADLADPGE
jgi:hypothetical protein